MTGTQNRATIKRRRIGALLRQYREAHPTRILSKTAARHIGVEPSHLGRIERGEYRIKPSQIEGLLGLYGIDDHMVFMELRRAALEPVDAGWWYPYRRELSASLLDYIALEQEAAHITTASPAGIPGLLQCAAYAREVQESAIGLDNKDHSDTLFSVRMARQQAVTRPKNPAALHAIISESVFYCGSPSMRDQIQHLITMSRQPNVTIQVMKLSAPVGSQIHHLSTVMEFQEPWPVTVHVDSAIGGYLDDTPDSAKRMSDHFLLLGEAALPPEATSQFMEEALENLHNEG